jgi:tetratricopeptide (TPR) repeat protein
MARDFLLELSGSQEAAAAEALAEELGCLPLALAQAGHYVRETHGSLSRYLKEFQANRTKALKRKSSLDAYEKTIYETFDLSIKAVQQKSKAAAGLMSLCGFFARRDIPLSLLEADPTVLPKSLQPTVRDSDKLNDALRTLKQFGLIDIQNEALSLHTLIHFIARERQTKTQKARWIEAAVRLINATLSKDVQTDLSTWPIYERISPHAITAVDHADPDGAQEADMTAQVVTPVDLESTTAPQEGPKVAQGGNEVAQDGPEVVQGGINRADDPDLSRPKSEKEHAITPRGIAPAATGTICLLIGKCRKERAQFSQTEPQYRRALAIRKASLGIDHEDYGTCLNDLGMFLTTMNRTDEAEPLLRQVAVIYETALGGDHPWRGAALNNLASLLKATNRLAEAEPLMRRALAIDEQSYGAEHPNVARDLNNLAQLLQATNRLADAEPLMRRALAIDEQSYGAEHPRVAIDHGNLSKLLRATKRYGEGERHARIALRIMQESMGEDHPYVAVASCDLAQLLQATNRLAEAEPLMRRALAIDEQSYGAEHPTVALRLNNLAQLLKATNRLSEAEPLMRRALSILQASLGDEHPRTKTAASNYEALQRAIGDS